MPKKNKIYGLLGSNISYSLSPAMHNAAFEHFGIKAEYKKFDIKSSKLNEFIASTVFTGIISGLNVTIPYKIKIKQWLEDHGNKVDNWVRIAGAVNTLKIDGDDISGYNTDLMGFRRAVLENFHPLKNRQIKNVFISGAGGAGRAIAIFLGKIGITGKTRKIYVFDIDKDKLNSLKDDFGRWKNEDPDVLEILKTAGDVPSVIGSCDLIVNATPLGLKDEDPVPVPVEHLKKEAFVYDIVYARETELVRSAKARGIEAVNGLDMLVNQGAFSFLIWNNMEKERFSEIKNIMKKKAKTELKRN